MDGVGAIGNPFDVLNRMVDDAYAVPNRESGLERVEVVECGSE